MTTAPPFRLAVIVGSTRSGRFGATVAGWFTGLARQRADLTVDTVDLADIRFPADSGVLGARLAEADAFVVVTPEYNHSFPAPLKEAVDRYRTEWQAKPVGFVSYGGISGGLRAVEQLRLVFAELHATTVRDGVSFHNVWERFDTEGAPVDATGAETAAKKLLDQLAWWALALRAARTSHPYAG